MSLLEIVQAMLKRVSILVIITIVFTVLGAGASLALNKEVYRSTTSLIVGQESQQETGEFNKINGEPIYEEVIEYGESSISEQAKKFYTDTLTRRDVLEETIDRQSLELSVEELRDNIKIEIPENSSSLLITVSSQDLKNVDEIADELATIFKEEVYKITEVEKIQTITTAPEPEVVDTVSLGRNIVIAAVAGLALGVVLVLILEYLDESIQSANDIENKLGLTVVGQIRDDSTFTEDLKKIRTAIEYSGNLKDKKIITVAALDSTYQNISSGLSDALVEADKKVLLIDGDFRTPVVQKDFELANEVGLSNLLTEELDFTDNIKPYRNHTNSGVLTAGNLTDNPSEQLSSNKMKQLIEDTRSIYDYVIINGHPINEVTDTVAMSTATDGIILVVKESQTTLKELADVQKILNEIEVDILGVVLIRA